MLKPRENEKQAASCALPLPAPAFVKLGHGSGGRMSQQLLADVFLPQLSNPTSAQLDDASLVQIGPQRIVVTTDAFVVNPIVFPGGDIGSLAVHGTVNDLACRGAKTRFITASFILEEGFELDCLKDIVASFRLACADVDAEFIAGDTKVVNKEAGDQVYISTCGIGELICDKPPAVSKTEAGNVLLVTGDLGRHGMAIMCAREDIQFESPIVSDSAPQFHLVKALVDAHIPLRTVRDITRGGLASVLNEIAEASNITFEIDESAIPIDRAVRSACDLLGLDPLYVACEGRLAIVVPAERADQSLDILKSCGANACIIGHASERQRAPVILRTSIGGRRIVQMMSGEQLPRIC